MKLPILNELPTSREFINAFEGYNHNLRISDRSFYDMKNLSSDDYPVLAPRKKRGIYAAPSNPQGLIAKEDLCYVDGSDFVINGYHIDMKSLGLDPDTPKNLVSMGAYVIILPDKMYINTNDYSDKGKIEASIEGTDFWSFHLCDNEGKEVSRAYSEKPEEAEDGDIYIEYDNVDTPIAVYQYYATNAMWSPIKTTVEVRAYGEELNIFESGDTIFFNGLTISSLTNLNGIPVTIERKEVNRHGHASIWFEGICDVGGQENTGSFTIERKMPNLDFIIESQNRLWGCRYGVAINGEIVNEIYASKLGDFKNWQSFAGISTDSWVGGVGTDGPFTGAINYGGYPIFFKENYIHKVYGNYPAQYQIKTTMCRGVQQGSEKSLAIVNEILYYKSRHAICSYDGALSQEISSMLGDVAYHDAVGGSFGNKYYISMVDDNNEHHLFVCDTARGMWHKEDNTDVQEFCNCRGSLYFVDNKDKKIKSVLGSDNTEDDSIKWMAESGIWGTDQPDKKYISRLDVRMSLNVGTRVIFLIQYDSSGEWEHLFTMTGTSLRTFSVPVKPKRCDHLKLRIEGEGEAKIYSICKTIEQGSDM